MAFMLLLGHQNPSIFIRISGWSRYQNLEITSQRGTKTRIRRVMIERGM